MCVSTGYKLEFSDQEWEEIEAFAFEGFDPVKDQPMVRSQWMAIAHIALGKAARIDMGDYGDPDDDMDDNEEWADTLRGIAEKILTEFRPGDGKF